MQGRRAISYALLIDEEGEVDSGLFPKQAGVIAVAQADGGQVCSRILKFRLFFAQLRDVLAAEDSTIVTEKHEDCRPAFPERTKAQFATIGVRQNDAGERSAD